MARLLGNPGILGEGGRHMAVHPGIILGSPSYLGIPGYLDKGGCPSCDNPVMAKLLGNPGILGQGGGHTTGHPGITPGWPSYLGIPGYLDKGRHSGVLRNLGNS